jgi:DnaK suppressor protein
MARKDALIRLQKSLLERRDALLRRLGGEIKDLLLPSWISGDSADMAFDTGTEEVSSQLAQLESRELIQIERSLERLKQGTYGVCESCQKRIPMGRLDALPFSTTCIQCQRAMETGGNADAGSRLADWGRVSEVEARLSEPPEVDLAQLEMDYSK